MHHRITASGYPSAIRRTRHLAYYTCHRARYRWSAAAAAAPPAITPPPAIADTLADAASPLSPSPLPHQTPPSFAPHFTMDDADIPDAPLPRSGGATRTLSIYQDVVCPLPST